MRMLNNDLVGRRPRRFCNVALDSLPIVHSQAGFTFIRPFCMVFEIQYQHDVLTGTSASRAVTVGEKREGYV